MLPLCHAFLKGHGTLHQRFCNGKCPHVYVRFKYALSNASFDGFLFVQKFLRA